jgi:Ca2+-binding EF-hand superfamily protein
MTAMLMKMDLGLSEQDVNVVMEACGGVKEGRIRWIDLLSGSERIIRCILHIKAWGKISVSPWVKLKSNRGDYYFNRMTAESEWANPLDPTQAKRMACLAPATHLESPPSIATNMQYLFHEYDVDNKGELDWQDFQSVLRDLGIGLTDEDIETWGDEREVTRTNVVKWSEFEPMAEELHKMFGNKHDWKKENPWIETNDAGGHPYSYNRQTGEAKWISTVDPRVVEEEESTTFIPPAPSLLSRLKAFFNQRDTEGTGELPFEEFCGVLNDLNIGLQEKDIREIQIKANLDENGTVRFHEFMRSGVPMLKDFMLIHNDSSWVVLHTADGTEYFFNNSSGESVWASQASDALKVDVFGPPKPLSIIVYHLKSLFQKYDSDGSGELEWDEFRQALKDLGLGLTEKDIAEWQQFADKDNSGTVKWSEFEPVADSLFKRLGKGWTLKSSWVKMTDAGGNTYRYNRDTGLSEWIHHDPPSMKSRIKLLFENYDLDGSGELESVDFWHVLNDIGIGLKESEIEEWVQTADVDNSGLIRWSEFEPMIDKVVKTSKQGRDWKKEDPWVELTDLGGHPYKYNRQTGESAWSQPDKEAAANNSKKEASVDVKSKAQKVNKKPSDHGLFILGLPQDRKRCKLVLKCWKGSKMVGGVSLKWCDIQRLVNGKSYRSEYEILSTQDYKSPPCLRGNKPNGASNTALLSGHFNVDRGGMVDLEVLQPLQAAIQKVTGLSICVSAVVEESTISAPHTVSVTTMVMRDMNMQHI